MTEPAVITLKQREDGGPAAFRARNGVTVDQDNPDAWFDDVEAAREFASGRPFLVKAVGLEEIREKCGDAIVPEDYRNPASAGEDDEDESEAGGEETENDEPAPKPEAESEPDQPEDAHVSELTVDEILAGTVDVIASEIASGALDERLDELEAAEEDGGERVTVLEAIVDRREDLDESDDQE